MELTLAADTPQPVLVQLPADVRTALEEAAREDRVSLEAWIARAVQDRLFFRRFARIRDRLAAKARAQGITSDEDVFGLVS